jgi:hypothetical protein
MPGRTSALPRVRHAAQRPLAAQAERARHHHQQRHRHHRCGGDGADEHPPSLGARPRPTRADRAHERQRSPALPTRRPPHDDTEREQLQHRQHRRTIDITELRGSASDLHLERRVGRTAQQAHGAEGGEREQEHHRRSSPQCRAQQGQHHVPQHLRARRAQRARCGGEIRGQHRPQRADQSHHHGDVEEHVGHHHGPARAVPRLRQQRQERSTHHDGGQHERHGDQRDQRSSPWEPVAGQQVGGSEPGHQRQHSAGHGLPQREPQHVAEPG